MSPATERAVERERLPRPERSAGALVIPASVVTLLLSLGGSVLTHRLADPPAPSAPLELVQRLGATEERVRQLEVGAAAHTASVDAKLGALLDRVQSLEEKIDRLSSERRR